MPLGVAFALRSERAEGYAVLQSCWPSSSAPALRPMKRSCGSSTPGTRARYRTRPAGAVGFLGNRLAAVIRTRAGRQLDSPALVADGNHARADAYVSLGVILSAVMVALGFAAADR